MNQGAEVGSNASLIELAPGGSPMTIAGDPGLFEPHGLAFDGTSFFATGGSPIGNLMKIAATGRSIAEVASMGGLTSVVVDDSCVYWSSFDGIFSLAK
jgi:hypothetical protein